ncbi:organic anion transporter 7-like [Tenrec ecaudatus]|uniref:organic anion transporter 7-like n=1 Tax=Tenrec ecaudatus TaxID=94439 RepID=UPI003F59A7CD
MGFQDLLHQVGGQGRFQIIQMGFLFICNGLAMQHILLENFTAAIPGHRCWVPILDNDTVSHNDTGILSHEALLRVSIPLDSNLKPEKCQRFHQPQWQLLDLNGSSPKASEPDTEPCVDGWVYEKSTFPATIVTKWDLVCESQALKSVAQFLFMTGTLVGALVYSHLSDRLGRRRILRWCLLQLALADTCVVLAPSFPIYCSLRFLSGLSTTTIVTNSVLLTLEWSVPRFQATGVTLMTCSYSIGQIILGSLAFAIREWQTLQLAVSVPLFVLFLSSRWLAESARWLIFNNKLEEGLKELRQAARMNGIKNAGEMLTLEELKATMQEEREEVQNKPSLCDLFNSPTLRKWIQLTSFVKFVNSMSGFGLLFNLQHLGNNVFLIQVLFGITSLIAKGVALWAMRQIGRQKSQVIFKFMLGIAVLVLTFVPQEQPTLRVILAILGMGAVSATGACAHLHSSELFPTLIRARTSGINIMASGSGAALSPLLMTLMVYSRPLPWIIYGIAPILAGFAVLLLPETRNRPLPDTIQDVENLKKDSKKGKDDSCVKVTPF